MTAARLVPTPRQPRGAAAAAAGVLLAVAAWAGWSALEAADATPLSGPVATPVPSTARPPAATRVASRDAAPAPMSAVRTPAAPPAVRALPVVPDGFVMEHGQLVSVRAVARTTAAPVATPPVTLPAGLRAEDVQVSPAGIVTALRARPAPADGAAPPPRPIAAVQSQ